MSYSKQHLREVSEIVAKLDPDLCEKAVELLAAVRARGGRLFILGVGGSAANASHAVNDFRKLAGIEAYAPTDNVSELTARSNARRNGVARSWGSWAATEDARHRLPMWPLSSRRSIPRTSRRTRRRSKPWCGICGFHIPISRSPRRNGKA